MAKPKYLNLLANESSKSQSWMLVSFFMFGFCVYLGFLLKNTINELPVRLIPFEAHINKGVIETSKNGTDNQAYIQMISRADIDLLTQFSPETAVKRAKQLSNRFIPDSATKLKSTLTQQAEENTENKITQSYLITNLSSRNGNEVLVEGVMKRWEAGELISDSKAKYAIKYFYISGIPMISSILPYEKTDEITIKLNSELMEEQK